MDMCQGALIDRRLVDIWMSGEMDREILEWKKRGAV